MDEPLITSSTQSFDVLSGIQLQLTCSSRSSAPVQYDWYNDGVLLISNQSTLNFANVSAVTDQSLYTCLASSDVFGIQKSVSKLLTVYCKFYHLSFIAKLFSQTNSKKYFYRFHQKIVRNQNVCFIIGLYLYERFFKIV